MTVPAVLHTYVILAKSASGAAAADLIKQATSASGVYTFSALLECENIQKLAGTDYESSLNLLKLFSWGTYQDYKNNQGSFPPLSDAQVNKLRRLTLVTLASETHDLAYSSIMQSLDITTTRDLEDLCINAIYANLLTGKLSPRSQTFQITSCTSRDLSPTTQDYAGMINTLTQWSAQCDLVLAEIVGRIRDVKTEAATRKHQEEEYKKQLATVQKSNTTKKKGGKGKAAASGGNDPIDEDVPMEDVEVENSSQKAGGESPSRRKRKGRHD